MFPWKYEFQQKVKIFQSKNENLCINAPLQIIVSFLASKNVNKTSYQSDVEMISKRDQTPKILNRLNT